MMNPCVKTLIILIIATLTSLEGTAQFSREPFAQGELLVKIKGSKGQENAFLQRTGSRKLESLRGSEWTLIALPKGVSVESARDSFAQDPAIKSVQPNYYYYLDVTPNDPRFGELYGMTKIAAPAAWDISTGSMNTIVAVIDTGIQYTHEDLAANIWTNTGETPGNNIDDDGNGFIDDVYGYDFRFNDNDPNDEHGHGTHVAGTIGAVGNNAIGVVGVNWKVRLMAIKIYDSTGFGTTSAMLINAYNYVTMMRNRGENIRVTNNSYSGCDEACGYDQATKDALDAMADAGILNVFAAGNQNRNVDTDPAYPGSYDSPGVLTVAASTSTDTRSGFSNFGVTNVDLAAPGSGILSTIFNGTGYGTKSGTSMASPHVAGAAGLLSSHNPGLSPASLKATLMNSVDQLANWSGVVKTGGRLNIANALSNQTSCLISLNPSSQFIFPEGGSFQVNVSAPVNCDYTVKNNASFATLTSASQGSGNSTVRYDVGFNSAMPRSGVIKIGDREFSISQSAHKMFPHRGFVDFEGDGWTDYSAIQDVNGRMIWHMYGSLGYRAFDFGLFAEDIPVPGHYDDDLINDIAVWRRSTGTFYVLRSSDGQVQIVNFGLNGDNPLATQDFDGDGRNDFAVTRKANGKLIWFILRSSDGQVSIFQFGNDTDKLVRGDYDGDGKADPAVYRPETDSPANTFFVLRSSDQVMTAATFGISSIDELVPNDFDGDGKTDFAVWRTTTGVWHVLRSSDGGYQSVHFGTSGDKPTPGDYDGDGRTDYSVWRPGGAGASGTFYKYSVLTGFSAIQWGNSASLLPAEIVRTP